MFQNKTKWVTLIMMLIVPLNLGPLFCLLFCFQHKSIWILPSIIIFLMSILSAAGISTNAKRWHPFWLLLFVLRSFSPFSNSELQCWPFDHLSVPSSLDVSVSPGHHNASLFFLLFSILFYDLFFVLCYFMLGFQESGQGSIRCVCTVGLRPSSCVPFIREASVSSLTVSEEYPLLKCLSPQGKPATNTYVPLLDLYICFMY